MSYEALLGILGALGMVLLNTVITAIWGYYKQRSNTFDELKDAVLSLKLEVKHIQEKVDELSRLKKDLDALFAKFRSANGHVSGYQDSD